MAQYILSDSANPDLSPDGRRASSRSEAAEKLCSILSEELNANWQDGSVRIVVHDQSGLEMLELAAKPDAPSSDRSS